MDLSPTKTNSDQRQRGLMDELMFLHRGRRQRLKTSRDPQITQQLCDIQMQFSTPNAIKNCVVPWFLHWTSRFHLIRQKLQSSWTSTWQQLRPQTTGIKQLVFPNFINYKYTLPCCTNILPNPGFFHHFRTQCIERNFN